MHALANANGGKVVVIASDSRFGPVDCTAALPHFGGDVQAGRAAPGWLTPHCRLRIRVSYPQHAVQPIAIRLALLGKSHCSTVWLSHQAGGCVEEARSRSSSRMRSISSRHTCSCRSQTVLVELAFFVGCFAEDCREDSVEAERSSARQKVHAPAARRAMVYSVATITRLQSCTAS